MCSDNVYYSETYRDSANVSESHQSTNAESNNWKQLSYVTVAQHSVFMSPDFIFSKYINILFTL